MRTQIFRIDIEQRTLEFMRQEHKTGRNRRNYVVIPIHPTYSQCIAKELLHYVHIRYLHSSRGILHGWSSIES